MSLIHRVRLQTERQRSPQQARGVSLVEALVALVVLSVGMLGIAGLYVESVRNGRTALLRTQAVSLVADMGDRIRANANGADAYDSAAYGGAAAEHDCSPTPDSAGGNCSVAELAEDDIARWQAAIAATLPAFEDRAANGVIEYVPRANAREPDRYRVTVNWQEPNGGAPYSYSSDIVIVPRSAI